MKQVDLWPSMVKQLLGSRKATAAMLEFLDTIGAGRRPRVQEQKQQERRRSRDKACGLDEARLEGRKDDKVEGNREAGDYEGMEEMEEEERQ